MTGCAKWLELGGRRYEGPSQDHRYPETWTLERAEGEFEEAGAGDGVVAVGGNFVEAERSVHGMGFGHGREGIETQEAVADCAGGGDHG